MFIKKKDNVIPNSLNFASGVMFSISILDLLPNAFNKININYDTFGSILLTLIFLCIGVIVDILIDNLIKIDNKLYKIGILSSLALMIHNIPEGIITFVTASSNTSLGILLAIAIALHNIPEGILISIPIYYAKNSRIKAFIYTFISGMSEFLGAILGFIMFKNLNTDHIMGFIFAFISGLMLYIAIYEIPNILKSYKKGRGYIYFIIGVLIMVINHIFFG